MALNKTTACTLFALGATLAGAQHSQHREMRATMAQASSQAWSLLSHTMEFDRFTACRGVIERRDTLCSGTPMRIWVEQSGDGKLKLSVLAPLSQQGITSVDDGRQWMTYHPDGNKVYVQLSPRLAGASTNGRIGVARRNYSLEVQPGHRKVAGRKSYAIIVETKNTAKPPGGFLFYPTKALLLSL